MPDTDASTGTDTGTEDTEAQQMLDDAVRSGGTSSATSDTSTGTGTGTGESDTDWQTEAEKWRELARKHEKNAKSNSAAAKRLAEIEDANKSESQKLAEQLTAAQQELQALQAEKARNAAAQAAGLPPEMWEFVTASDPDEAEAQAKRLAERVKPPEPPAPNYAQGARGSGARQQTPDEWLRAFAQQSRSR